MSKRKPPEPTSVPVEKMPYLTPFRLSADDDSRWIIIDFCEQNITDAGELCKDKLILIRSNTGVQRGIAWGTRVLPIDATLALPEEYRP
jgi:hypothetical protein